MGWKFWVFHVFMVWVLLVTLGGPDCPTKVCVLSTPDYVIAWLYILGIPYGRYLWRKYGGIKGVRQEWQGNKAGKDNDTKKGKES